MRSWCTHVCLELGLYIEHLVVRTFLSQHSGSLIHCLAVGCYSRKIRLPPSETLWGPINRSQFTNSSETAAAAFSIEDACRHFCGLKVNVQVKVGVEEGRGGGRGGREVGKCLNVNSGLMRRIWEAGATWCVYSCAAGCCRIDRLLRLFFSDKHKGSCAPAETQASRHLIFQIIPLKPVKGKT